LAFSPPYRHPEDETLEAGAAITGLGFR